MKIGQTDFGRSVPRAGRGQGGRRRLEEVGGSGWQCRTSQCHEVRGVGCDPGDLSTMDSTVSEPFVQP